MNIEIVRSTALFPSSVFVQWNVLPDDGEIIGDFYITVDRSGGPEGPWETIAVSLKNTYHFLDDKFNLPPKAKTTDVKEGVNLFSLSRTLYYRVSATDNNDSPSATSDATPVEPGLDTRTRLLKRKILHDEAIGFRRLNGIQLYVMKRRRWGTRCQDCFDPATKESVLEHCKTCFGTTYQYGYWAPVLIRGRRDTAPVQTQMTAHGPSDRAATTFIVLDYPHLERGDVIVDLRRNDRWLVEIVAPTELKSVTVHQELTCSLLGRNSVEYSFPVDRLSVPPLY